MNSMILIPALDLEGTIGPVILRCRESAPDWDILVVDDGSTDGTVREASAIPGVRVISHESNRGKGAALRTGFQCAVEEGREMVLTLDGDGQHPPEWIPRFRERMEQSGADVVVGSRRGDHSTMPRMRRLSNRLSSWMASRAAGQVLPDSQSGFRLIRSDVLRSVRLTTNHYETETELLIGAVRKGFRIESVPIPTRYGNEKSHINVWKDTGRFIRLLSTMRSD